MTLTATEAFTLLLLKPDADIKAALEQSGLQAQIERTLRLQKEVLLSAGAERLCVLYRLCSETEVDRTVGYGFGESQDPYCSTEIVFASPTCTPPSYVRRTGKDMLGNLALLNAALK